MVLKKWLKVACVVGCVVALAACSSKRKPHDDLAVNDANAAYSDDAQAAGLGDDSGVNEEGGGSNTRRMSANHRVYHFDYDSSNIREEDKPAIGTNANRIAGSPKKKVIVEGHTDPRGSREYNVGLGERRAKAVSREMSQHGVRTSQMRIVSYGAEKLVSDARNETAYQEDRRAVLADVER